MCVQAWSQFVDRGETYHIFFGDIDAMILFCDWYREEGGVGWYNGIWPGLDHVQLLQTKYNSQVKT
jgi:hypothetical protein